MAGNSGGDLGRHRNSHALHYALPNRHAEIFASFRSRYRVEWHSGVSWRWQCYWPMVQSKHFDMQWINVMTAVVAVILVAVVTVIVVVIFSVYKEEEEKL